MPKFSSPRRRERLTATLKAHEQATGNQIAVLTIATINGQSVEEYATKVFEAGSWDRKRPTTASSCSSFRRTARCASRSATDWKAR